MGLLSWVRLRRAQRKGPAEHVHHTELGNLAGAKSGAETPAEDDGWELVLANVATTPAQRVIPSIVATAIAAAERPDSEFVVRRVEVANPEARRVAIIATAIAAGDKPESEFVVRRVLRKKSA